MFCKSVRKDKTYIKWHIKAINKDINIGLVLIIWVFVRSGEHERLTKTKNFFPANYIVVNIMWKDFYIFYILKKQVGVSINYRIDRNYTVELI